MLLFHIITVEVCLVRRLFIKSRVESVGVVECNPLANKPFSHKAVSQFVQVNSFRRQGSPEAFDKDIIEIPPAPVHRYFHVGFRQRYYPRRSGELFALVGVQNLWRAIASCNAPTQKPATIVLDKGHESTLHVAQSIMATRYRKPSFQTVMEHCSLAVLGPLYFARSRAPFSGWKTCLGSICKRHE